jgi:hypothetical protein
VAGPKRLVSHLDCRFKRLIIIGNFYSIENDYDKEARIFFSQGCEILEEPEES